MKKIITTLFLATILLTGCSSNNNTEDIAPNTPSSNYETQEFKITRPTEWITITSKEFTSDISKDTLVVFRNNIKNETFTANVNIVKRGILNPISSLDFAKQAINRESQGLVNYKELKKETINIKIGEKTEQTLINYFEAKETTNKQTIKYIQTYAVKGKNGYIITGAMSTKEESNVSQTIETIVKSFILK